MSLNYSTFFILFFCLAFLGAVHFKYQEKDDVYICPNNKKMGLRETQLRKRRDYKVKVYATRECIHCQLKENCSKSKTGRRIERFEFEDALERQKEK